jgi:20S proteasome alpha/beta subunit
MTLTVCLQGKSNLILASDSRITVGDPRFVTAQNDTVKKVYKIGNVGIAVAGSLNSNMIIEEVTQIVEKDKSMNVTKIMEKFKEIGRVKYQDWFGVLPYMAIPSNNPLWVRPQIDLSIVGYDNHKGEEISRMYSLSSTYNFGPTRYDYGYLTMGVTSYAVYLLNRLYSNDMDIDGLKHLAAYVITETATQDGKVGGNVQMLDINSKNSKIIDEKDISLIIEENKRKAEGLKSLFKKIKV